MFVGSSLKLVIVQFFSLQSACLHMYMIVELLTIVILTLLGKFREIDIIKYLNKLLIFSCIKYIEY